MFVGSRREKKHLLMLTECEKHLVCLFCRFECLFLYFFPALVRILFYSQITKRITVRYQL